jgi:hypothetical protein
MIIDSLCGVVLLERRRAQFFFPSQRMTYDAESLATPELLW